MSPKAGVTGCNHRPRPQAVTQHTVPDYLRCHRLRRTGIVHCLPAIGLVVIVLVAVIGRIPFHCTLGRQHGVSEMTQSGPRHSIRTV